MNAQSFPLSINVPVPSSHWDGLLACDLFAPCGTPWLAVFDGLAEPVDVPLGGYALFITAADGFRAYYAHGSPQRVSGSVRAGQIVGYVSDSGNAQGKGCHLHFAAGRIDAGGGGTVNPRDWLAGNIPRIGTGMVSGAALLLVAIIALLLLGD